MPFVGFTNKMRPRVEPSYRMCGGTEPAPALEANYTFFFYFVLADAKMLRTVL